MADNTLLQLSNTHRAIYLKIGDSKFERLGEGVNSFTPSNNPTVSTKHYINMKSPHNSITAIAKQYSMSADYIKGDPCLDFIEGIEDKIGSDCVSELIDVDMSSPAVGGSSGTSFKARKANITISVTQPYSIEGGNNQQIEATFYVNGDLVDGTFDTSSKSFTPA